ncbi:MAG: EF-hand domain-containing protein [Flavobacteriales bacterium]|nr:EF-hand domain-containing protein [Flavobacteriales bacterium]
MVAKKKIVSAVALVIGLTTVNEAQAQQDNRKPGNPPSVEQLFKEMDGNEDGFLSKTEVKGPLSDDFKKIDANEDGLLSKEELEKAPKPAKGQRPPR